MTTEEDKKMTHAEEMEYLKKYDPILYSELTSDPTGASEGDGCSEVIFICLIALGVCGVVRYLLSLI